MKNKIAGEFYESEWYLISAALLLLAIVNNEYSDLAIGETISTTKAILARDGGAEILKRVAADVDKLIRYKK